jgi:hypothetical protein
MNVFDRIVSGDMMSYYVNGWIALLFPTLSYLRNTEANMVALLIFINASSSHQ